MEEGRTEEKWKWKERNKERKNKIKKRPIKKRSGGVCDDGKVNKQYKSRGKMNWLLLIRIVLFSYFV